MATVDWQRSKDKVLSWLDNEQQCVTAQRISQSLNLSRKDGSSMLQEILTDNASKNFQITTCQQEEVQEETHKTTGK